MSPPSSHGRASRSALVAAAGLAPKFQSARAPRKTTVNPSNMNGQPTQWYPCVLASSVHPWTPSLAATAPDREVAAH
eukprot:3218797-Pyramimonas_sp.AAC.1